MIDRASVRRRPHGCPLLHQRWSDLLFVHWRFAPELVRPIVPAGLELDLFDGHAWVGLTPFTVSRMRPTFGPPLPGLSAMHEINLRIYVHRGGIPGIWFPSLDADHRLAVWGARLLYRLPYYRARMQDSRHVNTLSFRSERADRNGAPAMFDAAWMLEDGAYEAAPDTLEFFLVERYVLYSGTGDRLLRARIHHRPWRLRNASLVRLTSTMLEAQRLPTPSAAPLLHAQAEPLDTAAWLPLPA